MVIPALFILRQKKSYFFLQKSLKTRVNSKCQAKGSTYILHLLAFVEIRLFNVSFWERKAGFRKLMKNVRDTGFSRKRAGMRDQDPPFPTLLNIKRITTWWWVFLNEKGGSCQVSDDVLGMPWKLPNSKISLLFRGLNKVECIFWSLFKSPLRTFRQRN